MVKKIYIRDINPEAFSIYETFKQKKGSEHISSPIGIQVLLEIIAEIQPKHILEIGGGIGALSFAALKHSDATVDIFENHPFCLTELKKNIKGFEGRFTLLTDYENFILPHDTYDLVIIDGGGHAFIHNVISKCRYINRIIIEGGRREQRKRTRRALRAQNIFRPIVYKHAQQKYARAHQIICYRNNSPLVRHLVYWFWEIVIFKEIQTSLTCRLKKILRLSNLRI